MSGSGLVALQSADSIDHKGAPTGPVALGSGRSSGSYSGAVAVHSGDAMGVAGNVSVVAGTASAGGGLALEPGRSSPAFRSHHPRPSWGGPSPSKRAGTATTTRRAHEGHTPLPLTSLWGISFSMHTHTLLPLPSFIFFFYACIRVCVCV